MAEILVLGAGMIGICSALELQARGHAVTLADRGAPGRETSFGNAGVIQAEAAEPYALPRDPRILLSYLLGRSNDVSWSIAGLMRMAPALWSYYRHSAPERHHRISQIYAQLTVRATEDHAPLITAAGAENLIARGGMTIAYRDGRGLEAASRAADRMHRLYGVTSRTLDAPALKAEEPALTGNVAGAVHMLQSWSCSDPGGLCTAYADLFRRQGGRIVVTDASSLSQDGSGWTVRGPEARIQAEKVVVALGPWSPALLRRFGVRVPMVLKRGYHAHFGAPRSLRRPLLDTGSGIVAASMQGGLRLATGAAIVPHDASPKPSQLDRGIRRVGEILDLGQRIDARPWTGTRPCMPDMLPVVGASPGVPGMWLNFGHGHQGFTLGPTSARILADAMDGARSNLTDALAWRSPNRRQH